MLPNSWMVGLALATVTLGVVYPGLCLVRAHYDPQPISKLRHCLLRVAIVIYPLVSAAFFTGFFITRRIPRTHTSAFALFCTWEIISALFLGAEILYLWLSIFPFQGIWILAVLCVSLFTAAILSTGLWSYLTVQRQWLWIFIPFLCGVLTLTGICCTNDAAPSHARYRLRWGYLTLPALLGLVLGIVAAGTPTEKAPTLQKLQHPSQSMTGFLLIYTIQFKGLVSYYRSKIRAKRASEAPRWDGNSLISGQSRQSLIPETMRLENTHTGDPESQRAKGLEFGVKTEGGEARQGTSLDDITNWSFGRQVTEERLDKPRPDSMTLPMPTLHRVR